MTSESNPMGGFCRLYSVLLYAYPPDFRRQYGRPMEQLLRDRCRDLARRPGGLTRLRFAGQVMADWLRTTVRERAAAWSAGCKPAKRSSVTEWAGTLLIYLFATATLVQAYVIPTPSMEGNLLVGDHILVDRMVYADPGPLGRHLLPYRQVERGDIVAFLYPEDVRQTYVKRIIGLPGDRIRIENGQVVRNGEVVVPPGMLFALGDNRDNSADSRYWGFVPRECVVGKPLLVYWSYDAPTADLQEWTLDHVIDVAQHFFTKTRWKRSFLVPRSQRAEEVGGAR